MAVYKVRRITCKQCIVTTVASISNCQIHFQMKRNYTSLNVSQRTSSVATACIGYLILGTHHSQMVPQHKATASSLLAQHW